MTAAAGMAALAAIALFDYAWLGPVAPLLFLLMLGPSSGVAATHGRALSAPAPPRTGRGGEAFLRRLFEPLGYEVQARRWPLDEQFPEWGESPYFSVELRATCRLRDLLAHLYVLIPVLDDEKHYWVGEEEVEKLLRH